MCDSKPFVLDKIKIIDVFMALDSSMILHEKLPNIVQQFVWFSIYRTNIVCIATILYYQFILITRTAIL